MNIVIFNGGNLGLACLATFSMVNKHHVTLYSPSKSYQGAHLLLDYRCRGIETSVTVAPVYHHLEPLLHTADMVLLTAPSFLHDEQLMALSTSSLPSSCWVGALQCAGGFFWRARRYLGERQLLFGFQRPPYTARRSADGAVVHITGEKLLNKVATSGADPHATTSFFALLSELLDAPVAPLRDPLEAMLTNSNPLLHPARLYEIQQEQVAPCYYPVPPLFYEEWGDLASQYYIEMDRELAHVYQAVGAVKGGAMLSIPSVESYYEVHGQAEMTAKLRSIQAFHGIRAVMIETEHGYTLDRRSRYFTEDIPYGLMTIRVVADCVGISTPYIDRVVHWAQRLMGEAYLQGEAVSYTTYPHLSALRHAVLAWLTERS